MALLETRLVASSFRSVQAASSVAARDSPPGQPGRCEGSGTKSVREQSALDALGETESKKDRDFRQH